MTVLILSILIFVNSVNADKDSINIFQNNSLQEPFDVGKEILYDVTISNPGHSMHYVVNLEIGPDNSDISISKVFKHDVDIHEGSSVSTRFNVNYLSPELRRGEFGNWLKNENETSMWTKAWYRVTIDSLDPFNKIEPLEDFSGKPALIKPIWELRNAEVNPRAGTNSYQYEYKVDLRSNAPDNLTLEVAPSRDSQWINLGMAEYTTPGVWQTLRWSNKTLNFDFGAAAYRFSGRRQETFDGPFWPVQVEFSNASVEPLGGTPSTNFNYSMEVNASRSIDVVLNVLDVGTKKYFPAGMVEYTNASIPKVLTWKDISVSKQEGAIGPSNFYFSFHYLRIDAPFLTTQQKLRKYYLGPNLSDVNLISRVTPPNGTINTPFTYIAEVSTSKPSCDIELEVAPPGSKVWTKKGSISYSSIDNNLTWSNITLDGTEGIVGLAKYRFLMDNTILRESFGPMIDVAFRNLRWERIGNTVNFCYKVEVSSSRPEVDVELIYTDDSKNWIQSGQFQKYRSNSSEWITLEWKNQPWHAYVDFDERR